MSNRIKLLAWDGFGSLSLACTNLEKRSLRCNAEPVASPANAARWSGGYFFIVFGVHPLSLPLPRAVNTAGPSPLISVVMLPVSFCPS